MKCLTLPQQVWLQSLMAHRVVTDEHALEMYKSATSVCQQIFEQDDYNVAYKDVGRALSRLGFEIRRTIDEGSGLTLVALVNTKGDSTAELATQYSPQEMTLIKGLVRAIFTAPDDAYCISTTQAINIGRRLNVQASNTRTEQLCNDLIRHGWIRVLNDTHYKLSARALLELQSYLQAEFPDHVHNCVVCLDLVTSGVTCAHSECDTYIHKHCKLRFEADLPASKLDDAQKLCSACEKPWNPRTIGIATRRSDQARVALRDDDEEGEDEAEDEGGEDEGDAADEQEQEDEASDEEDPAPRRSRRASRASASLAGRKRQRVEDVGSADDEEEEASDEEEVEEEDDKAIAMRASRRNTRSRRSSTE